MPLLAGFVVVRKGRHTSHRGIRASSYPRFVPPLKESTLGIWIGWAKTRIPPAPLFEAVASPFAFVPPIEWGKEGGVHPKAMDGSEGVGLFSGPAVDDPGKESSSVELRELCPHRQEWKNSTAFSGLRLLAE